MNTYFVKLDIYTGEFEKQAHHLVGADDIADAEQQAVLAESHDELVQDGEQWEDAGGEFAYCVNFVKLVAPEDLPMLEKYMSAFHHQPATDDVLDCETKPSLPDAVETSLSIWDLNIPNADEMTDNEKRSFLQFYQQNYHHAFPDFIQGVYDAYLTTTD